MHFTHYAEVQHIRFHYGCKCFTLHPREKQEKKITLHITGTYRVSPDWECVIWNFPGQLLNPGAHLQLWAVFNESVL